jgi:hypothetical protein
VRVLVAVGVMVAVMGALSGCGGRESASGESLGSAPLRGFGVQVDQAVSAKVPVVHLKTCGPWGCHEQDVPLSISGPTSAAPCGTGSQSADAACGVVQLPGPGPGYGYAPVPGLTQEPATVTVTTPRGAPLRVEARLQVRPRLVCPGPAEDAGPDRPAGSCAGSAPQAQLRIAADGTVSQSG